MPPPPLAVGRVAHDGRVGDRHGAVRSLKIPPPSGTELSSIVLSLSVSCAIAEDATAAVIQLELPVIVQSATVSVPPYGTSMPPPPMLRQPSPPRWSGPKG